MYIAPRPNIHSKNTNQNEENIDPWTQFWKRILRSRNEKILFNLDQIIHNTLKITVQNSNNEFLLWKSKKS